MYILFCYRTGRANDVIPERAGRRGEYMYGSLSNTNRFITEIKWMRPGQQIPEMGMERIYGQLSDIYAPQIEVQFQQRLS